MQDQIEIFEAAESRDPRLRRLFQYWREKCRDRQFPDRGDLDPIDFRYILGFVTIVDIVDIDLPTASNQPHGPSIGQAKQRYYFRLDGSQLAEISGMDYTGRYLDELPWPDYVDFVRWTYDEVQRRQRPLSYRRQGKLDEHSFDEETLIMPLSDGRGRIEKLLVAVIPGEFDPAETAIIL